MSEKYETSPTAATVSEVNKNKLIEKLLKQGRVTLNEARILNGLDPINNSQSDRLIKRVE